MIFIIENPLQSADESTNWQKICICHKIKIFECLWKYYEQNFYNCFPSFIFYRFTGSRRKKTMSHRCQHENWGTLKSRCSYNGQPMTKQLRLISHKHKTINWTKKNKSKNVTEASINLSGELHPHCTFYNQKNPVDHT